MFDLFNMYVKIVIIFYYIHFMIQIYNASEYESKKKEKQISFLYKIMNL